MVINNQSEQDKRITGRTSQLCIKLTPQLHQELKEMASKRGILITELIEEFYRYWLKNNS